MKKNIACFIGTRPEVIKVAPVYLELKKSKYINPILISTGQHKELLHQALVPFNINPNKDLKIMTENQTPSSVIGNIISKLDDYFISNKIIATLVQGDTATCFSTSLSSYLNKIPVGHIESGLRTYDMENPWPEEAMRQMTDRISKWHFTPTKLSQKRLIEEKINPRNIYITGNTVIDSLDIFNNKLLTLKEIELEENIKPLIIDKYIVITAHRRENYGKGFKNIAKSINMLAKKYKNYKFIFPIHPSPNVKNLFEKELKEKNVHIIKPVDYITFLSLMKYSALILSDSGGIQEEISYFNKEAVLLRRTTERPEGIDEGFIHMVGTNPKKIYDTVVSLFGKKSKKQYTNPYGDGKASKRIRRILEIKLGGSTQNMLKPFKFS